MSATTLVTLRTAIQERFRLQVAVPQSITTTVQDNGPEPAGIARKWCRLRITAGDRKPAGVGGLGGTRYRTIGAAIVEFHVPGNQGSDLLAALFDALKVAFQGARIASPDLVFTPPPFQVGEIQQTEGWARLTAQIPYRLDEVE